MRIVLLLVCALSLSGCSDYVQQIYRAAVAVNTAVEKGRDGIRSYCAGIGSSVNEAGVLAVSQATGQCRAIVRTQAIVDANRAICNNVDTLTAAQLYTYGKKLITEWNKAKNAVVAGC